MHNPQVPETLDGWSLLHQMFRLDWRAWRALEPARRRQIAEAAADVLGAMEGGAAGPGAAGAAGGAGAAGAAGAPGPGATALVSLLGHKGDLMLAHFRPGFEELAGAQLRLAQTDLHDFLIPTTSYVSVVELGMYEMTAKIHKDLATQGLEGGSEAFERAFDEEMRRQRERVVGRLFCEIPQRRYVCFYPMSKKRAPEGNWYSTPFEKRAAMMREHGMIGRHYAGQVTQIISGSIGFDDWEWGVDLFADEPLVFKKLIYEMRFDEASAVYAEFGPFYVGMKFAARDLPRWLEGRLPSL
jgi:chlorite dismutase